MDILKNIKNILKNSFWLLSLLVVFSLVATEVAEAKTINSSVNYVDEAVFNNFNNLYLKSGYKNFLFSADEEVNYLCLTNDDLTLTDELNASSNCDKMYIYFFNESGDYVLDKYNDNSLVVVDSVYYANENIDYTKITLCFVIGLFISLNVYVLYRIYNDFYKR